MLEELIKRSRRLEEEGRKIAYEMDRAISEVDLDWLMGVMGASLDMEEIFTELSEYGWPTFLDKIASTASDLHWAIVMGKAKGVKRKDFHLEKRYKDLMREMDKEYEKATGEKRCTWLLDIVEPYTFSTAINDLTACFHRAIEKLEEISKEWEVEGKCMWRR